MIDTKWSSSQLLQNIKDFWSVCTRCNFSTAWSTLFLKWWKLSRITGWYLKHYTGALVLAFQIGFRDRQMLGLALGKHLFLQSSLFVFPLYMNTFIFFSRWPDPYRNGLLGGCIVCNGSVTLVHLSTRTINYVDLDRQPTCIMRAKRDRNVP